MAKENLTTEKLQKKHEKFVEVINKILRFKDDAREIVESMTVPDLKKTCRVIL